MSIIKNRSIFILVLLTSSALLALSAVGRKAGQGSKLIFPAAKGE